MCARMEKASLSDPRAGTDSQEDERMPWAKTARHMSIVRQSPDAVGRAGASWQRSIIADTRRAPGSHLTNERSASVASS